MNNCINFNIAYKDTDTDVFSTLINGWDGTLH